MKLEEIFAKKGIKLRNSNGRLRNVVDVIEDMYLKLNSQEFTHIMFEISEEEVETNLFNNARNRPYKEAE